MASSGLTQKRILVTDVQSDFGKEIANALVAEGALVFTLVKECRVVQQVVEAYPQLTPILLDIGKEKCDDQARKVILSLPTVDHFVNLSGDGALNIILQAYANTKIHDVTDTKIKPIVSKMVESGGRPLVFNVSFGDHNMMSKLKANLDPRYANSKTAQISTNLRQSLKKMFSSGNGESSKQTSNGTDSGKAKPEPIVKETNVATNFAALATSINQNSTSQNGHTPATTTPESSTVVKASPNNSRIQNLAEKNNRIRQSALKLQNECAKKWKKAEKKSLKEEQAALKALHKEIDKAKKIEKANILKNVSDANATRTSALSEDTANKILEARENRANKEAEKHAQKKLEQETSRISESKDIQLNEYHEKLYKKTIDKQINEFNRIKSKYLV